MCRFFVLLPTKKQDRDALMVLDDNFNEIFNRLLTEILQRSTDTLMFQFQIIKSRAIEDGTFCIMFYEVIICNLD